MVKRRNEEARKKLLEDLESSSKSKERSQICVLYVTRDLAGGLLESDFTCRRMRDGNTFNSNNPPHVLLGLTKLGLDFLMEHATRHMHISLTMDKEDGNATAILRVVT